MFADALQLVVDEHAEPLARPVGHHLRVLALAGPVFGAEPVPDHAVVLVESIGRNMAELAVGHTFCEMPTVVVFTLSPWHRP